MLIHIGIVIKRIISPCELGLSLAIKYAQGYPIIMHITVVITASFKDLSKTSIKILSWKKRIKLSKVNFTVNTEFPCFVKA